MAWTKAARSAATLWITTLVPELVPALKLIRTKFITVVVPTGFTSLASEPLIGSPELALVSTRWERPVWAAQFSIQHNQVWGAKNVFCTDGSAMVSAGCQNPSLTYMALTARAADYAVKELKNGNL
jgi:hypothetical protein